MYKIVSRTATLRSIIIKDINTNSYKTVVLDIANPVYSSEITKSIELLRNRKLVKVIPVNGNIDNRQEKIERLRRSDRLKTSNQNPDAASFNDEIIIEKHEDTSNQTSTRKRRSKKASVNEESNEDSSN